MGLSAFDQQVVVLVQSHHVEQALIDPPEILYRQSHTMKFLHTMRHHYALNPVSIQGN